MIRIGLVGLDSTHAVAFTELFNATSNHVVAAAHGMETDFPLSIRRRAEIAREVTGRLGVPLVGSIDELVSTVDAIMILSADGRQHLTEARVVLPSGKPTFIDKPLAANARDGAEIFRLARQAGAMCFSASALRFSPEIGKLRDLPFSASSLYIAQGPLGTEPGHPDFSWYGIHTVEALYTAMGAGCRHVTRTATPDSEVATGVWPDGRVGEIECARVGPVDFEVTVTDAQTRVTGRGFSYSPLVAAIGQFFATRHPPVSADETLEMLRFIDAADASKAAGGVPVPLTSAG
jgi:hypothetical protein